MNRPSAPQPAPTVMTVHLSLKQYQSWPLLADAVWAYVTQAAHQSANSPSLTRSQRRVTLAVSPAFLQDPLRKAQARSVSQAMGQRLAAGFAVRSFRLVVGAAQPHHSLSWQGF